MRALTAMQLVPSPACRISSAGGSLDALVHVRHVEHRLRAERLEARGGIGGKRRGGHLPDRPTGRQRPDHLLQPVTLGPRLLGSRTGLLAHALESPLCLLEVGEQELGLHDFGVCHWVGAAVGVGHAVVAMSTHDVADRVRLPDRRQEAVSESLAPSGASNQARDVVELDRLRQHRARPRRVGHLVEALVRHLDQGDVRVNRGEGVGRRLRAQPA